MSLVCVSLYVAPPATAEAILELVVGADSMQSGEFAEPIKHLLDMLKSRFTVAVAVAGVIVSGTALMMQGGELKDFMKVIIAIVLIASLLLLAVNIIEYFFGAPL